MIVPVYAALERIPHSYIEASARPRRQGRADVPARSILPLALPGVVAGSIFTFSLTLGDYITPTLVGGASLAVHRQRRLRQRRRVEQRSVRRGVRDVPLVVMGDLPRAREARSARSRRCDGAALDAGSRSASFTALVIAFLWIPIVIICLYAFNSLERAELADRRADDASGSRRRSTTPTCRQALWLSLKAAALATGDRARARARRRRSALHRFRFFGREAVSFLFVLPIALPGIITGMALNSFFVFWKMNFGLWTIVIGHATFCVVSSTTTCSRGCGGRPARCTRRRWTSAPGRLTDLRFVTLPTISTALISGALLAFALSFDEVIVTTFTAGAQNTLPLWIFGNIRLGQTLPEVNVVVCSCSRSDDLPVVLAQRLTRESGILRTE